MTYRVNKYVRGLIVGFLAIFGTFVSRWHGGGFVGGSPKQLKNFLWSLPFSFGVLAAWFTDERSWLAIVVASIATLAWCMVMKSTGHGGGIDLAESEKEPGQGRTVEKLEYLILWLHDKIDRYWYDFLMLTIIGLFGALLPAILIGMVTVWA